MPPVGITAYKVNRARANAAKMMPDLCTIRGTTGTPRAEGVIYSNVPCLLYEESPGYRPPQQELTNSFGKYVIEIPYGYTLAIENIVLHNGHSYQIWELVDDVSPIITVKARIQRMTA